MPNTNRSLGVYISTGDPDTENVSSLYRGGDLGKAYDYNDRAYQVVQVDSGITADTGPGVVAANQLAYWKDKNTYLVTNDFTQAIGGSIGTEAYRNQVAGIFRCAATSGYYCHILQRGDNIAVACTTTPDAVGELVIADNTASQAYAAGVNVGTASTHQIIGKCRTAASANVCYADVDIPNIP